MHEFDAGPIWLVIRKVRRLKHFKSCLGTYMYFEYYNKKEVITIIRYAFYFGRTIEIFHQTVKFICNKNFKKQK